MLFISVVSNLCLKFSSAVMSPSVQSDLHLACDAVWFLLNVGFSLLSICEPAVANYKLHAIDFAQNKDKLGRVSESALR